MNMIKLSEFFVRQGKKENFDGKPPRRAGFTLAEVLITVVIISILATLVIPRFAGQSVKGETAEAIEIMSVIRQSLSHYYDTNGNYPSALADQTAIENTLQISYTTPRHGWTFSTDGSGKAIATKASGAGAGGTLTLDPEGFWNGTGDFDPATGKYWPQLK